MRTRTLISVVCLLSCVVAAQPFRSSVDIVRVTATVVDRQGKFVAGLTKDGFRIVDGGVEQPIVVFSAEPQPVSVAFLIDISGSMAGPPYEQARHAIDLFGKNHLGPRDEVFACVFNSGTTCARSWTRDRFVVAEALASIQPQGGTQLFDAFEPVLDRFGEAGNPKLVLVVLSDGKDVTSQRSLSAAHRLLRRAEVLTYAIVLNFRALEVFPQMNPALHAMRGFDVLHALTSATGGRTLRAVTPSGIAPAVEEIANELGRQYQLGYHLPRRPDGKYHEIRVEVKTRGHEVRARRGYLARRQEK